MSVQKKPLTAASINEFTTLESLNPEEIFPTRDANDIKIEVTELFTHFTASIIRQDTPFTR